MCAPRLATKAACTASAIARLTFGGRPFRRLIETSGIAFSQPWHEPVSFVSRVDPATSSKRRPWLQRPTGAPVDHMADPNPATEPKLTRLSVLTLSAFAG